MAMIPIVALTMHDRIYMDMTRYFMVIGKGGECMRQTAHIPMTGI